MTSPPKSPTNDNTLATHRGGCHCRAVTFTFEAPRRVTVQSCNCSMCAKVGFIHLIVPASRFRLLQGQEVLSTYTFNTGVAQHHFCSVCGVKSFYVPRSNPNGYSINMRCIAPGTFDYIRVEEFDGQNWEDHADDLTHLSQSED